MLSLRVTLIVICIVASYAAKSSDSQRIETLRDQGFFLGRGKWTTAHKQLLSDACNQLNNDISLARECGSVAAFLAWKCGLPQHRIKAQMTKYHAALFTRLQTSFLARYVFLSNCLPS